MALVRAFQESEQSSFVCDPFDWSVEQVVYFLCSSDSPVLRWGGGVYLPDSEGFKSLLREEQINGETLLTAVTKDILRDDLGIKALGPRTKIFNLIIELQHQSFKYQQMLERKAARQSSLSSVDPTSRYPTPYTIPPQYAPFQLTYDQASRRSESGQAPLSPKSVLSTTGAAPIIHVPCDDNPEVSKEGYSLVADTTIQPHESSIIDANGRQRRRLAPTFVTEAAPNVQPLVFTGTAGDEALQEAQAPLDFNVEDDVFQPTDQTRHLRPVDKEMPEKLALGDQQMEEVPILDAVSAQQPGEGTSIDLHRDKPLKSTPVTSTTKDRAHLPPPASVVPASHDHAVKNSENVQSSKESSLGKKAKRNVYQVYYGPSAFHIDDVFYSDIEMGKATTDEEQSLTTEQQEMAFASAGQLSDAKRLFVNTRMKYFFLSTASNLIVRRERNEVGIVPYPDRLGKKHHPLSMTVLSQYKGGITKLRANRLDWTTKASSTKPSNAFNVPDPSTIVACEDGNWDALDRYRYLDDGDRVLPTYGDSDSEEDYDSQTYREMQAESRGPNTTTATPRRPKLTMEEVETALDDSIKQFCEEWQTKRSPKFQHKAWRVWAKARRDRTTESQIEETIQRLADLKYRIVNLRTEISKEEWFNVNQVMKQSKSLQPSVFEREENSWKLAILESKCEPPKLPAPVRDMRKQESDKLPLARDEEKNASTQDSADDEETDDDLDEFIVDDEVVGFETQILPENEDVSMADDDDMVLSDTMADVSTTVAVKKKDESLHHLTRKATAHTEAAQRRTTGIIDLTQASDSPDSPPAKAPPTRIVTPPLFKPDEDNGAWFARSRSIKAEFKAPPKIEDEPIIYLDGDSSSDIPRRAPVLPPVKLPPLNDVEGIAKLNATHLVEKQDRKRLLIWLIAHSGILERNRIIEYVNRHVMETCLDQVKVGLKEMKVGKVSITGKDQAMSASILQVAAWYIQWTIPVKLDSKGISVNHIDTTLDNDEGFDTFFGVLLESLRCKELSAPLRGIPSNQSTTVKQRANGLSGVPAGTPNTPSKRNKKGKAREDLDSDSSALSSLVGDTPRIDREKKKPREEDLSDSSDPVALADLMKNVPESQETLQKRGAALQRMYEDTQRVQLRARRDARRKELMPRLATIAASQTEALEVILNPGKLDDCDLIRLNPEFGRGAHLKPHQKEGLQFMWREITGDHNDLQGCLLAQTMGLGKTIQVIALLVAISDAVNSPSETVREQVPAQMHRCQTLVLCPPALIENWWDEFLMWPPASNHLGELRKVSASLKPEERISEILAWEREGGILLLGYTTFRDFIQNRPRLSKVDKAAGKTGYSPLDEATHREIKAALLDKANIVVADEAHEFKNITSHISQAINQIKCKTRIALTGSPLSNNLGEYFATIDWISPRYLGSESDFKTVYENPIQQGLQEDASAGQYRESRKRLKALELALAPKVHRADLSALHGNLHGKSEFVVRVPLTAFQDRLYRDVILRTNDVVNSKGRPKTSAVWAYLSILQVICNHPGSIQLEQEVSENHSSTDLSAKGKKKANGPRKQNQSVPNNQNAVPLSKTDEDPMMDTPLTGDVVSMALGNTREAFDALGKDKDALDLSNKMQSLMRIIELSGLAKDKVLVFSHRHATLDYIGSQLNKIGTAFVRIDGKTLAHKRQSITKSFNEGPVGVCLISTRAGGQGLNMFGANRVVILDSHFNPMWEQQAIGRAYRIGQQKHVYIYRLTAAGTFEEEMQSQGLFKEQLATRVLEKKNPHRVGTSGGRQYLFTPKEVTKRDVTVFAGKDPLVLDHLLADEKRTPILSITPSETFMVDDGQDLTAQEIKEAEQMFQDEQLRLRDPAQYHAKHYPRSAYGNTQMSGESSNLRQYPPPSHLWSLVPSHVEQAVPSTSNLSRGPSESTDNRLLIHTRDFEPSTSSDPRPWHEAPLYQYRRDASGTPVQVPYVPPHRQPQAPHPPPPHRLPPSTHHLRSPHIPSPQTKPLSPSPPQDGVARADGGPIVPTDASDTKAILASAISTLFPSDTDLSKKQHIPLPLRQKAKEDINSLIRAKAFPQLPRAGVARLLRDLIAQNAKDENDFRRILRELRVLLERGEVDPYTLLDVMIAKLGNPEQSARRTSHNSSRQHSSHQKDGKGLEATNPIDIDGDDDPKIGQHTARAGEDRSAMEHGQNNHPIAKLEKPTALDRSETPKRPSAPDISMLGREDKENAPVTGIDRETEASEGGSTKPSVSFTKPISPLDKFAAPERALTEPIHHTTPAKRPNEEGRDDESANKKQRASNMFVSAGQKLVKLA